jgi:hypothetical protein
MSLLYYLLISLLTSYRGIGLANVAFSMMARLDMMTDLPT